MKSKIRAAKQVGIVAKVVSPAANTVEALTDLITSLNNNEGVHAIIV